MDEGERSTGLIDTYYKPEGGLLLSAGNGIMGDTPLKTLSDAAGDGVVPAA